MKKALLIVMAAALIIGFAGCDIWPFGKGSPYFPLKEGNTWDYEGSTTVTSTTGENDPVVTEIETSTTTKVVGEKTLSGDDAVDVWELESISVVDTIETTSYSYVRTDKDYVYYYEDLEATDYWFRFPADPIVGDSWDVVMEIDSVTTTTTTYEVVDDGVEANGYTGCLKIEITPENAGDYEEYSQYVYWAEDVGNVMSELNSTMVTGEGEYQTTTVTVSESRLIEFTEM